MAGPDGNLWFTASGPLYPPDSPGGSITEFHVPTGDALCGGITAGPDGNLWFAEQSIAEGAPGKIGQITTAGVITEFSLPPDLAGPFSICSGPDGNLGSRVFHLRSGALAHRGT